MDLAEEHRGRRIGPRKAASAEKPEKPCRTCTDFKSLMKAGPATALKRPECPVDKSELGRASWKFLHTMSVNLPENKLSFDQQSDVKTFVETFSRLYPCEDCAEGMRDDLKVIPPVTRTGKEFATWLCGLHNRVNEKLDKPVFDCAKVYVRWRDGWKDGSCDPPS